MVSNLVVFSTTVPEMLGCVCCHRKERKKKRSLFMWRSQSILLHPSQQSRSGVLETTFPLRLYFACGAKLYQQKHWNLPRTCRLLQR